MVVPEKASSMVSRRGAVYRRDKWQQQHRRRRKDVERNDICDTEELRHEH